ncbi:unnamed protein product, partial [Prorocentrum cordatum]
VVQGINSARVHSDTNGVVSTTRCVCNLPQNGGRRQFTKRTMTFKRHLHHKAGETVAALGETSSAQSEQLCLALREPGIDPAIIGSAETGRPLRPPLSNRNPDRETAAERPPRPLPPVGGPEARRAPLPVAGRRPPSPPRGSARAAAGARGAASGAGSSPCRATAPSAADLREAAPSARACRAGSCSVDSAQGGGLRSPQSGRWWPLWAQKGLAVLQVLPWLFRCPTVHHLQCRDQSRRYVEHG